MLAAMCLPKGTQIGYSYAFFCLVKREITSVLFLYKGATLVIYRAHGPYTLVDPLVALTSTTVYLSLAAKETIGVGTHLPSCISRKGSQNRWFRFGLILAVRINKPHFFHHYSCVSPYINLKYFWKTLFKKWRCWNVQAMLPTSIFFNVLCAIELTKNWI